MKWLNNENKLSLSKMGGNSVNLAGLHTGIPWVAIYRECKVHHFLPF